MLEDFVQSLYFAPFLKENESFFRLLERISIIFVTKNAKTQNPLAC